MKALILVAAIAVCIFAQSFVHPDHIKTVRPSGKVTTISPSVSGFDAIEIGFPMRAHINIGDEGTSVRINGDENILSYLKTKVRGNTLYIYCDDNVNFEEGSGASAYISLPSLKRLALSNSEAIDITGKLKGDKFHLDISGSGKTTIDDLSVSTFESEISGSGKITINGGSVNKAKYDISGSAKINAYQLQARSVYANISGSGKTEVTALEKLSADISGSGIVRYKGRPEIENQNISGSGELVHED